MMQLLLPCMCPVTKCIQHLVQFGFVKSPIQAVDPTSLEELHVQAVDSVIHTGCSTGMFSLFEGH